MVETDELVLLLLLLEVEGSVLSAASTAGKQRKTRKAAKRRTGWKTNEARVQTISSVVDEKRRMG